MLVHLSKVWWHGIHNYPYTYCWGRHILFSYQIQTVLSCKHCSNLVSLLLITQEFFHSPMSCQFLLDLFSPCQLVLNCGTFDGLWPFYGKSCIPFLKILSGQSFMSEHTRYKKCKKKYQTYTTVQHASNEHTHNKFTLYIAKWYSFPIREK